MATINDVVTEIETALQDACAVAGVTSPMDALAAANAALDGAQAQVTSLQAQVASLTTTDNALQAEINKTKADLATLQTALTQAVADLP